MEPKFAWEAVLDQLRLDMAKATYDTWVKDTHVVAFEVGTFIIGVDTAYARDWLESRLASTVTGLLAGILDQSVEVQFVVQETPSENHDDLDDDDDQGEDRLEIDPDMKVSIERSLLEIFTKPDSALYFPGYWLRWVPYIGPKPFATILAFRQALYLAENCFKERHIFAISADRVGEIIGVTRQTIARQRDGYTTSGGKYRPPQLEWFLSVKKVDSVKFSSSGEGFAREPHQYSFKPVPITPADMEDLIEWLLNNGFEEDPVKALEHAIETQPKDILKFPMEKPTKAQSRVKPSSARADLHANILSYCPADMDQATRKTVLTLTDKLRARILASDGQVKVPLYFLKHVMPRIGTTPAVLIMYLRKKAYRNSATGEIRERVVLKNGLSELATFLGVAINSMYNHLPIELGDKYTRKSRGQNYEKVQERRNRISSYISNIEKASGKGDETRLTVATLDTLIPEHKTEYDLATSFTSFLIAHAASEDISELFDHYICSAKQGGSGSSFQQANSDDPSSDADIETLDDSYNVTMSNSYNVTIDDSYNATMGDSYNGTVEDSYSGTMVDLYNVTHPLLKRFGKCNDIKYLKFKYLEPKILRDLILQLKTNLNSLTTSYATQEVQEIKWTNPLGKEWDLKKLFKSCRIDQKTQKTIQANQVTAAAFVSHILYAFSPEGAGLREGDGNLGHGPRHDRLAGLGPEGIQNLIRSSTFSASGFQIPKDIKGAQDWGLIMKGHNSAAQILELGELLGLLTISY
jgi:hypothetical protein